MKLLAEEEGGYWVTKATDAEHRHFCKTCPCGTFPSAWVPLLCGLLSQPPGLRVKTVTMTRLMAVVDPVLTEYQAHTHMYLLT